MISWVEQGQVPEKAETRGKAWEVMVSHSMFDPEVFKMRDGVLMFKKAANRNRMGEVWRIWLPKSMVSEVWSLCHQSAVGVHRGLVGPTSPLTTSHSWWQRGKRYNKAYPEDLYMVNLKLQHKLDGKKYNDFITMSIKRKVS